MYKKIAITLLVLTVLGAAGAALAYNTTTLVPAALEVSAQENAQGNGGAGNGGAGNGQQGQQAAGQQNEPQMAAEGSLGEPWVETGVITGIEDVGISMALETGEVVFIELGPADYWQTQGITLLEGDTVMVEGSINEGMIHATQVVTNDGQVLVLRTEMGQPAWSGGASNEQGQNSAGSGEPQIQVDEWVTLEGTLMSFQGGSMTMSTADGSIVSFKTGQPRFFSAQGVTFQVGEQITVVGFYNADQFQAGDITQVSTGARVMLLDPNGRPLWAGQGNGNGNGGKGNSENGSN